MHGVDTERYAPPQIGAAGSPKAACPGVMRSAASAGCARKRQRSVRRCDVSPAARYPIYRRHVGAIVRSNRDLPTI